MQINLYIADLKLYIIGIFLTDQATIAFKRDYKQTFKTSQALFF
jgi:hypothetical protein